MSTPDCSRCIAVVCRSVCGEIDRPSNDGQPVAAAFAALRDIEEPDYSGEEMRELAISTWRHVCFMADREEFKASLDRDLAKLSTTDPAA